MGLFERLFGRDSGDESAHEIKIAQLNTGVGEVTQHVHVYRGSNLPLPDSIPNPKGFVGREVEISHLIKEHKDGKRSFVLSGIGGVGKTELARSFARHIAEEYAARIEIPMGGMTSPISSLDAMSIVANSFNPLVGGSQTAVEIRNSFLSFLARHKTILLVDDARDAEQIRSLTEADCCLIVTSRQRIYLDQPPLDVKQMSDNEAVQLLEGNGGLERFGEYSAEIARLCGNLPLALKIVRGLAVNRRLFSAAAFVNAFRIERLNHLDEITTSLNLSYDALSSDLQEFWRLLSVFPSTFEASAAATIWSMEDVNHANELLDSLGSHSLLEFSTYSVETTLASNVPSYTTFYLHDLAREFAWSKLSSTERTASGYAHSKHYGILLSQSYRILEQGLVFYDAERNNIVDGFHRASANMASSAAYREACLLYTGTTVDILALRLTPRKLLEWMDKGIAAARAVEDSEAEAIRLNNRGIALQLLGQYDEAIETFLSQLEKASAIDDLESAAKALSNLGICYDYLEEFEEDIRCYADAAEHASGVGDNRLLLLILVNSGVPLNKTRRFQEARETFEKALRLSRDYGSRKDVGKILSGLAESYDGLGYPATALKLWTQSLGIAREYGDKLAEGIRSGNIGNIYYNAGKIPEARSFWSEAVTILESVESPQSQNYSRMLKITA